MANNPSIPPPPPPPLVLQYKEPIFNQQKSPFLLFFFNPVGVGQSSQASLYGQREKQKNNLVSS